MLNILEWWALSVTKCLIPSVSFRTMAPIYRTWMHLRWSAVDILGDDDAVHIG